MTSPLKSFWFFFVFILKKKIDSMMPWVCTVLCLRGCSLCSYHILMSFVIYYKTDARHYGISLISRYVFQSQDKSNFKPPSFLFTLRKKQYPSFTSLQLHFIETSPKFSSRIYC